MHLCVCVLSHVFAVACVSGCGASSCAQTQTQAQAATQTQTHANTGHSTDRHTHNLHTDTYQRGKCPYAVHLAGFAESLVHVASIPRVHIAKL
jgi:hypothetical protein